MDTRLRRDVRFLKVYSAITTLLLAAFALTAFTQGGRKTRFEEIDVERINVVEKDGKLKMVISNAERQHPGVIDGRMLSRARPPGLLFFNEKGDECGGLSFSGDHKDGKANAGALLAFDRFRQDQTVAIQYGESDGLYTAGLRVWDRPDASLGEVVDRIQAIEKMPDGPEKTRAREQLREMPAAAAPQRVFVGKTREKAAVMTLSDPQGAPAPPAVGGRAGPTRSRIPRRAGRGRRAAAREARSDKCPGDEGRPDGRREEGQTLKSESPRTSGPLVMVMKRWREAK